MPKAHKRVFQDLRFPWHAESALYLNDAPIVHAKRQRVSVGGRLPVSTYLVHYESSTFRLVPKLVGGAALFGISEKSAHTKHEEHEIGSIVVAGWLMTRTVIDLPERLPLFLQVYLFWLSRSVRDLSHHV